MSSSSSLRVLKSLIVPKALPRYHKGQLGRLVVIGGCEDYTGAPFFSAIAAMTLGCDLVHVICSKGAAGVIKSYSPDLMVHPYLIEESDNLKPNLDRSLNLLERMDTVIVGPGFGRDEVMKQQLIGILQHLLMETKKPVVLDADSLYHLSTTPKLISMLQSSDNSNIILTPNVVEFQRLADAAKVKELQELSLFFNCTIVQKGERDLISTRGGHILVVDEPGSLKRVGGQGDTLTGLIGTLLCWGMGTYKRGDWIPESELHNGERVSKLSDEEIISSVCYGGCYLTRKTCHLAYQKYGRSLLTSEIHHSIMDAWIEFNGDKY